MRILSLFITLSCSFLMTSLHAQMAIDGNTLYGNEWINHNQNYYKCYVTEDGMYRISTQSLSDAGVPVAAIQAGDFQLYALGNQVPVHVSTSGTMNSNDYIEFYGKKNRGELDTHLYANPDDQFNPYYSMFTDSTAYFLTWENTAVQFQNTPNNLTALPSAEPYFMDEQVLFYNDRYHKGEDNQGFYESRYTVGEGFGTRLNHVTSGTLSTPYAYTTSGVNAELNMKFAANSSVDYAGTIPADHNPQLTLNSTVIPFSPSNFSGYDVIDVNETFPVNLLSSDTVDFQLEGLLGTSDKYSTAFVTITYPRQFNFDNQDEYRFKIDADAAKKYLEITNFNHGGTAPVLYDLTNNLRITTNLNGSTVRIALPSSATERELLLVSQNNYHIISDLDAVNFVDYTTTQGDYIIISNPLLFDDDAGNNYVQQYANYRASTGFTPVIITTEQLYDQFAYGISRHSQSVRNLTGYTIDNWAVSPKYMFMIGKSRGHYSVRKNWVRQPAFTVTFGHQSADILLTATNTSDVPRIAFGKLPVTKPDQIRIYLNKVMAHENLNLSQTIEDRAWQKRIIHLAGQDPNHAQGLADGLKKYEAIAKDEFFGADVTSFWGNTNEPVDYSTTHLLDSLINEGSAMITFHGHSTPHNINFNIRRPEEYNNTNRYPLFLCLGAYSGQIHTKSFGLSEEFVFAEDKGAIAFIGLTWLAGFDPTGVPSDSDPFPESFYQKMTKDNYGEGIGDIHRAAVETLADDPDVLKRLIPQQMTLNGDPAVRLHAAPAPDYLVNTSTSNITFAPDAPATDDALELTFNIVNLGKAESQPVKVLVERVLPNGDVVIVVNEMVDAPSFEEEYTFDIPAIADAVGTNEFVITLDSDDLIVELPNPDAEGNNTATASIFIYDAMVEPFFPTNYGIESDANNVILKAEINDRYANQSLDYVIQIDTSELFNSPIKEGTFITQTGGILQWSPPMNFVDGTVYYWRTIAVPGQITDAADWETRSFIYLDGEQPGWNQSHHYQFLNDNYNNTLLYDENTREFEYAAGDIEVVVNNAHVGVLTSDRIDYSIAGRRIYDVEGCEAGRAGIYVVLIDENAQPIENQAVDLSNNIGQYGSYICKPTQYAFTFPTDSPAEQQALTDFLNNTLPTLPNVSNILIYSLNDYLPETWNQALFDALASVGATDLQNVTEGAPYAALIDVADNTAQQMTANSESDILEARLSIRDSWSLGSMTSTIIGPALEWGSLHWKTTGETGDNAHINVYGINDNGQRTLLAEDITATDHFFDVNVVNADTYPYLQLEYATTDAPNQTPPQLDFWRVLYTPNPCYNLQLTAFLEGAYDVNISAMDTYLSNDRKILPGQTPKNNLVNPTPAGQPYSLAPWNHVGAEGADFTDSNYSGSEVDWVLVSLRTDTEKADEVSRAAGLMMKDGTIRFPAECPLRTDEPGPFFIVAEHRNHVGIMSPQLIQLTDRDLRFDFTTQDSYRDATSFGQVEIVPGVWAMLGGDLSQTADVQSYDVNGGDKIKWTEGNGFFDTYRASDADMNGDTNGSDKIIWERNNGKSSRVPR